MKTRDWSIEEDGYDYREFGVNFWAADHTTSMDTVVENTRRRIKEAFESPRAEHPPQ